MNDNLVVGDEYGKIKAMIANNGQKVDEALPGMAVRVQGLKGNAHAGELMLCTHSTQRAIEISEYRQAQKERAVTEKLQKEKNIRDTREAAILAKIKVNYLKYYLHPWTNC